MLDSTVQQVYALGVNPNGGTTAMTTCTEPATYSVVRRWRKQTCTITVHSTDCPTVKRAEVAFCVTATSPTAADAAAYRQVAAEIAVGTSHFGATCRRCSGEHQKPVAA